MSTQHIKKTSHTILYLLLALVIISCSNAKGRYYNDDITFADKVIRSCRDSIYTYPKETEKQLSASLNKVTDSTAIYLLKVFIGSARFYQGDKAGMMRYYNKAKAYCSRHPRDYHLKGFLDNNIAIYEMLTGQRDSAIVLYEKANQEFMTAGDTMNVCTVSLNLASMQRDKGEMAKAAGTLRDALQYSQEKAHKTTLFAMMYTLAVIYADMHSFHLSDDYFHQAQLIMKTGGISLNDQYFFYNFRGNRYFYAQQYDQSLKDHKRSLEVARQLKNKIFIAMAQSNIGEVESALGRNSEALPQLLDAERTFKENGITDARSMAYLNDLVASVMARNNDIVEAAKRFQATDTTAIADSPLYMMYHYDRLADFYKATGRNAKALECSEKARHKELLMMQELFSEQMAEAHARYQKDKKLANQKAEIQQQKERLHILIGIVVMVVIIAGAFLIILIWTSRRKRQVLRLKYQRELAGLSLQNLRNRISPHFVMNLLGREVSPDDKRMIRLVKFIRQNLYLVDQTIISLSEELEFVNDYVELERKSLTGNLDYTLDISPDVDTKSVLIPAMTVQLFVENAFKHGLRGQCKDLFLKVIISRQKNATHISIDNNGADSQANSSTTKTGLKIVRQTIEMFNKGNERHIQLEYGLCRKGVWHVEISIPNGFKYNTTDK